jgi:hypothetical protein
VAVDDEAGGVVDDDLRSRLERLSRWLGGEGDAVSDEDVAWLSEHQEYLVLREIDGHLN